MKVKCTATRVTEVAQQFSEDDFSEQVRGGVYDKWLTIGDTYVVYALETYRNQVTYYLWGNDDLFAPGMYPAILFQVIDSRLSPCWECRTTTIDHSFSLTLAFPEWLIDPGFYSRLFDDDHEASDLWKRYRELMDAE